MSRPRVLHVSQPTTEGVARWVATLSADQAGRGWPVAVACPDGWLAERTRDTGAQHLPWPAVRSPVRGIAREVRALRRLVQQWRPDVVHLHSSKAGVSGRLALRGTLPTLFQPHGWSWEPLPAPLARAASVWERSACRWTSTVVCVSEGERQAGTTRGLPAPSLVAVPNGIDVAAVPVPTEEDRRTARLALGLPLDRPVAVQVGRLARQKGQDLLLDAWPAVLQAQPDACLHLVGDGPDRAALEARADWLPSVHVVGARDDVDAWLVAADVVVLPSRWEGLALVALEAAARARCLVTTEAAGMAEVHGQGGEGALVPLSPETTLPARLAAVLAQRLRDRGLADAEGVRLRGNVEQHLTLEQALRTTRELLASAAGLRVT